jgi:hypothetical protein
VSHETHVGFELVELDRAMVTSLLLLGKKKRHPVGGGGPTMLISLESIYRRRVTKALKVDRRHCPYLRRSVDWEHDKRGPLPNPKSPSKEYC